MLDNGDLEKYDEGEVDYDFDLFVIGAGSGGVRASRFSAQYGAKVITMLRMELINLYLCMLFYVLLFVTVRFNVGSLHYLV